MPITPKLATILQDAYDAAEVGAELVCGLSRNNLHRSLEVILKRAEIKPWVHLYQTLRRSCATEWKQPLPSSAVDRWMGHSERVSREHYLMIPDDLWDRTTQSVAKCAAVIRRTPTQGLANGGSKHSKKKQCQDVAGLQNPSNVVKNAGKRDWAEADLNRRHTDFQSVALPTELPARWGPMHDAASLQA